MLNPNNTVVVWHPIYGMKVRNCQTTVYPPGQERRDIIDPVKRGKGFNKWAMHIRTEIEAISGNGEAQLNEAKRILETVNK